MKGLWIIFKKEVIDAIRDRRAIMVAMVPAILGPAVMMFMLQSAADTKGGESEIRLQVRGQEHAPDLIAHLEANGVAIEALEGDPKPLIQGKEIRVAMAIPDDFAERFSASKTASVELFADYSLETSEKAARRVLRHVQAYGQQVGSLRLMVRGVDPNVAQPVDVQIKDFSTRTSRASLVLLTLQLIFLMAAFFGGAGVAVDTTAGERERKSWEPLLVHPLASRTIAGGKWLAVTLFATVACLLSLVAAATALKVFSLEALGIAPHLPIVMLAGLFALQVPMAFFASALQMMVSIFAKTFKEAQGFLGMLTLLPMLPVVISIFKETQTATWVYFVPVAGQQQLMTSVMRGEGMDLMGFAISTSVTLAVTALTFTALARLLRSERVVFGS